MTTTKQVVLVRTDVRPGDAEKLRSLATEDPSQMHDSSELGQLGIDRPLSHLGLVSLQLAQEIDALRMGQRGVVLEQLPLTSLQIDVLGTARDRYPDGEVINRASGAMALGFFARVRSLFSRYSDAH